ncbi:hypothetical protein ALC53_05264 [Atta colombica]|uniref:Uncharacterized protein n=1 Tax=Atta colombica TaxID=520822 RepID=A0A195BI00_9HYME|nr:hypothetical protein ALC53_05264 [Atta colombica]
MPKLISRLLILPALGACTTISIFIADSTINGAPFSTVSPTFTLISQLTVHFEKHLTFAIFRKIFCDCKGFDTKSFALLNCDIEYFAYFRPREKDSSFQFIYRTKLFLEVQIILRYFRIERSRHDVLFGNVTSECGGSIQSYAHTFARTKNFYSSSIWLKILSRIFRGYSTLNRESLSSKPTLRLLLNAIAYLDRILRYLDIIYFENLYKPVGYNHESRVITSLSLFRITRTNAIAVNWLQPIMLLYVLDVLDIPRPPPPYAALKIIGRPCFIQNSIASSELVTGPSVPGTIGTPA